MSKSSVVFVGAKRTAIGSLLGQFTGIPSPTLGATAIKAAIEQSGIKPGDVCEVIMGCVLPANLGQAPARQAMLQAGIPSSAAATTINKVCGSGMRAIMFGYDLLRAGSAQVVVAGGMESMTNAPHMIPNSRSGTKYGPIEVVDHMAWDGLTNPSDKQAMGVFGELCADKYKFSREAQDAYAAESVRRAQAAITAGHFKAEIAPVTVSSKKGDVTYATDESPGKLDPSKIPSLKAAFKKDGTITAATSSSISDGAAATILMREEDAKERGIKPIARLLGHTTQSQEPEWFTTAPVGAIKKLLAQLNWKVSDVDLFEVNEAFAVVAMAPMHELDIPHAKINVHGGACALGHPIGATGARIVVTLIHALQTQGKKRGIAALCIGGGEATAVAIELID
jgi:acetyl-CoA C-acetyltransferase